MVAGKIDREVANVMGSMAAFGRVSGGEVQIDLVSFNHYGVLVRQKSDPEYVPMIPADDNISHVRATGIDGFLGVENDPGTSKKAMSEIEDRLREKVEEEKIELPADDDGDDGQEDEDDEEDPDDGDDGEDEPVRVRPGRK